MPISILVIDDSDSMRSQIIRTLREAALFDQCHEARDGIEGFKILIQNREFPPRNPAFRGGCPGERLRKSVGQMLFPPPMEALTVTASLGVSSYPCELVGGPADPHGG